MKNALVFWEVGEAESLLVSSVPAHILLYTLYTCTHLSYIQIKPAHLYLIYR